MGQCIIIIHCPISICHTPLQYRCVHAPPTKVQKFKSLISPNFEHETHKSHVIGAYKLYTPEVEGLLHVVLNGYRGESSEVMLHDVSGGGVPWSGGLGGAPWSGEGARAGVWIEGCFLECSRSSLQYNYPIGGEWGS